MNKKGFTPIELLAVIVILAIITLIATPIVLNIIKDSRESAGLRSAEMYLKGVETSVATATINNKKVQDGTYEIVSGDICLGTVEVVSEKRTCNGETLNVEMNGEKPESGSITIASGKITDIAFTYSNGKTIVKDAGKLIYEGSESENDEQKVTIIPKKETYTIGEEVTIGEESFYVMADDAEKVTLLAKDCIDTTNLVQSVNANGVAFSSTNYWSNISRLNLNEYPIPEGVTTPAITAAKAYGEKLGGIGRLMTIEEVETLSGTEGYADIVSGINGKSSSRYLYYWLASAYLGVDDWTDDGDLVYILDGEGFIYSTGISAYGNTYDGSFGSKVRPVVEISKSLITN